MKKLGKKPLLKSNKFEIRLNLSPEDEDCTLYDLFKLVKEQSGIKNNTEIARLALKRGLAILIKE